MSQDEQAAADADEIANGFAGRVGYAIKNLETGAVIRRLPDEPFPTASAVKLPILTAFHQFVAEGRTSWDATETIDSSWVSGGSGILEHLSLPREVSYRDAAWLMICLSDNLATNVLLRKMGLDYTNEVIHQLVGSDIEVRKYAGFSPSGRIESMGRATPRALLDYLEKLAADALPGATATVEVARQQMSRSAIPRCLPVQAYGPSSVVVAHKTGALPGIRTDIALLESPGSRVAMVVMTDDALDRGFTFANEGERCIGAVARVIYQSWMGRATSGTSDANAEGTNS